MKTECPYEICKSTELIPYSNSSKNYFCMCCRRAISEEEIKEKREKNLFEYGMPKIALVSNTDVEKFREIGFNKNHWYSGGTDDFPSIIAHEYHSLREFCKSGTSYGAFLQIKDVFEVILKFPTLCAVAALVRNESRSAKETELLYDFLKMLSLGSWRDIACRISVGKDFMSIKKIIENAKKLVNEQIAGKGSGDLCAWRNEKIGHGATMTEFEKEFFEEFTGILQLIRKHLEKTAGYYSDIAFYGVGEDGTKINLSGKENARKLQEGEMKLFLEEDGTVISLYPFIIKKRRGIYFYDSFSKTKTGILSYPDALKESPVIAEIQQLQNNVEKEWRQINSIAESKNAFEEFAKVSSSGEGSTSYTESEAAMLNKLQDVDDYFAVTHLEDWLSGQLNAHTKGVFLLQMEAGTGKTTFSRALDPHSLNKNSVLKEDGASFTVRAYYCDSLFFGLVNNFVNKCWDLMRKNDAGDEAINPADFYNMLGSAANKKDAFAKLLTNFRKEYAVHFRRQKLLFIIDGLDEMKTDGDVSISDFVPEADLLPEGVYILLTSRIAGELNPALQKKIEAIPVTARKTVRRTDSSNSEVLRSYLKLRLPLLQENQYDVILQKAENRFLYVKAIKELVASFGEGELANIENMGNFVEHYFNKLKERYGRKYFNALELTAVLLASAFEPLTQRELAYLREGGEPSMLQLAYLLELRAFLNIDRRTYRGSTYIIKNELFRKPILDLLRETLKDRIRALEEESKPENVEIDFDDDGQTYFLTYTVDYGIHYFEKKHNNYPKEFVHFFARLGEEIRKKNVKGIVRERAVHWFDNAISIAEEMKLDEIHHKLSSCSSLRALISIAEEMKLDEILIGGLYLNKSIYLQAVNRIPEAVSEINRSIDIFEKFPNRWDCALNLSGAHINRGNFYAALFEPEKALEDYDRGFELLKQLKGFGSGDVPVKIFTGGAHMNRGNCLSKLNRNEDALNELNRGIAVFEELRSNSFLGDEIQLQLAKAYIDRSKVFGRLQKNEDALIGIESGIGIMRAIDERQKLFERNDLAEAYFSRGCLLAAQDRNDEAITDLTKCIEIRVSLENDGNLFYRNELAAAYLNRAFSYYTAQRNDLAFNDTEECIRILTLLECGGKVFDKKDLERARELQKKFA